MSGKASCPSPEGDAEPFHVEATKETGPYSPKEPPSTYVHHPTVPDKGEYVVDSTVSLENVNWVHRYQVRWNGYSAAGDTMEPKEHIPRKFIALLGKEAKKFMQRS